MPALETSLIVSRIVRSSGSDALTLCAQVCQYFVYAMLVDDAQALMRHPKAHKSFFGFDPKTLQNLQHCQRRQDGDDTDGSRVYPDIIVHHRKEEENLLVIEVKKSTSGYTNDCDEEKLKEFRSQPQYKYSFGIFLKLRTGTNDISQQNVIKKLRFIPKT